MGFGGFGYGNGYGMGILGWVGVSTIHPGGSNFHR